MCVFIICLGRQPEHAASNRRDGVAPHAGAEIEDPPGMADEAQLARHRQSFFDQTRLADLGLATDMDRAAATLRQGGVQHALQLGKLQTAAGQWGTRR
jgi:hypothetical protein